MEQAPIVEQPVVQEPVVQDPFSVDEAKFASLSPEQRASLDPVLSEWKTRASEEISKRERALQEKYKPDLEKATALTQLVARPEFQQWWQGMQRQSMAGQSAGTQSAIAQTKPSDVASAEEWNQALWELQSNNDPSKFQAIQQRMMTMMSAPVVQQLRQGQEELKTTLEMKDLFERHPDAKELDAIGRDLKDINDNSPSVLEMALNWAADNNKTLEDGYQMARRWANQMKVGAQQQAMGMVQDKKQSITSGPGTGREGPTIVEVEDKDELLQKSMEYSLDNPGKPLPRFVIRAQASSGKDRWAQRT